MSSYTCSKIFFSVCSSSFCKIGFNSAFGVLYCATTASFYPSEVVSERLGLF